MRHISCATQSYLKESAPNFIKKNKWPSQYPDCSPIDYYVWGSLSEKVYRGKMFIFKEKKLKDTIKKSGEKYLIMKFEQQFCLETNVCEQLDNIVGYIDHLCNQLCQ